MRVFASWCSQPIVTRETAPSVEAVTLEEAKAHLRLEHDDDDDAIEAMLAAAREHLEGFNGATKRAFIAQDWRVAVTGPDGFGRLFAPVSPASAIVSIQYYPPDSDTLTTATAGDFRLIKAPDWAYIEPKAGKSWPSLDDRPDALQAVFTCGYGDAAEDVPAPLLHAIKLLVGHLYENREEFTALRLERLPFGVESLISTYRNGVYG